MSSNYLSDEKARKLARYYSTFEIGTRAPAWAIKRQYRRLAKIWHPDKHASDPIGRKEAEHRMKRIIEAYDCIRDAPLRFYQRPKAPQPKVAPAARDIDLSALAKPMPSLDRENAYFVLGCLGVPTVLMFGLIIYVVATYGLDFSVQGANLLLLLAAIIPVALCSFALWELTGVGDWLVKTLWG